MDYPGVVRRRNTRGNLAMDKHPIQEGGGEGVAVLLVLLCCRRNRVKLRQFGLPVTRVHPYLPFLKTRFLSPLYFSKTELNRDTCRGGLSSHKCIRVLANRLSRTIESKLSFVVSSNDLCLRFFIYKCFFL